MSLFDVIPALLVLADGTTYHGWSFGAAGTTIGEVLFNTSITGYQEVLTDPSYRGQIVIFTYPELGNTGINLEDEEAKGPQIHGLIARSICYKPSNWRSTQSLPDYLKQYCIPGIFGIDTRALTRKIRMCGTMNGGISTEILDKTELLEKVKVAPNMEGLNLVKTVTTPSVYEWFEPTHPAWEFNPKAKDIIKDLFIVIVLDFGVKRNILRRLISYGCRVIVVPADITIEEILQYNPDGIFLSNGPGDPAVVEEGMKTVKALIASEKPIFGICMGHQILGRALGAETFKLKFGHRGINQPVGLQHKHVEITSQNHSFAIQPNSLPSTLEISHFNLNDQTVAGLRHKNLPIFSVQYHPEASPGTHDADYLFEQFVELMRSHQQLNK